MSDTHIAIVITVIYPKLNATSQVRGGSRQKNHIINSFAASTRLFDVVNNFICFSHLNLRLSDTINQNVALLYIKNLEPTDKEIEMIQILQN